MGHKEQYERLKKNLISDEIFPKYNKNLFKKFIAWEEEKLKRMNKLSELDEANYKTLKDYPNKFRNVNRWFENKDWNKLSVKEIRQVYNDLEDAKILNTRGVKFGDIRSYVNKMFKAKPFHLAGLKDKVEEALEFFVDKRSNREVRFVNEKSFKLLVEHAYNSRDKCLFWLMWDIGENINSLLQLQKKHFKKQFNKDMQENEYMVFLPEKILKRTRRQRREPTLYSETVKWLDIRLEGLGEEDCLFPFVYRQALKIFDACVKRSKIKCEPNDEKPTWKDLRSGMACYLFEKGWHLEDINLRLGHSPTSKHLESYINYLATNRTRAKKEFHSTNLGELKEEVEESRQREKRRIKEIEELKKRIDTKDSETDKVISEFQEIKKLMLKMQKPMEVLNKSSINDN